MGAEFEGEDAIWDEEVAVVVVELVGFDDALLQLSPV